MAGGSSLYLPLPQNNTDSESEEELHSGIENNAAGKRKQRYEVRVESSGQQLNYRPLDNDRDLNPTLNGFSPTVTVLQSATSSVPALSTTRKALFVFSILVCIMTIVGFLWILPCDINPCPSIEISSGAKGWETPLYDFELHGPISVVPRAIGSGKNVVLLARRAVQAPQRLRNELLCLLGGTGDIAWTHMLVREPLAVDCNLLDVNKDGILDCVVAGSEDLLKTVDPLSGMGIWEVASSGNSSKPTRTQFPVLLPDLTGDNVPELLTARSYGGSLPSSHMLIISGVNGQILGKVNPVPPCAGINDLVLEIGFSVSYTCLDVHGKKSEQTVGLVELILRAGLSKPQPWSSTDARDLPRKHEVALGASLEAHVDGIRLLLENQGHCPSNCRVVVLLKDNHNQTRYNNSLESVYGMAPATLSFDRLTGFVLKYWYWHNRRGKGIYNASSSATASETPELKYRRPRRRSFEGQWVDVTEQVVLITFNGSDVHVVNVSQQMLVQLCRDDLCQPSSSASRRSLSIADLDGDGSKELISYMSSYITINETTTPVQRRLQARVRVVRLEAELPQLYEALNHL